MCNEYKIIEEFFYRNREQVKNPIIRSFLADAQNLYLVQHAILHPNDCNLKMVDETFQAHYQRVQKIKYISNLIYFFSLDFDKKKRRLQNRFLLVADSGLMDDGISYEEREEEGLLEKIENEQLFKGLQKLTDKQLQILEMIYVKDYSIKVIAETLKTTPQNISNLHRKALKKLHHIIRKEEI
ncbi:sigma-70 family RNA polymerase sigma factor [Lysinibacillus capsici]|uniref:sigma-70 family RNA polymerase sigma factor n=1 Tax=Lysinibacillus TaxID=400634 RepID=UPI002480721F|nr:sigma-70 family RNA polymerase sigma factor [Lysinibacillus capsici]WPK04599.1 sigma-70 family RNA polymerase sigma factor [Lysinibacillus capsici]